MTYRVIFARNKIVACNEIDETVIQETPYYEYHNGHLTFAIVKTESESQARSIAKYIALELIQRGEIKKAEH